MADAEKERKETREAHAGEVELVEPLKRANEGVRPGRAYTEELKTELVSRVIEGGEPIAQVAREVGVGKETLAAWLAEMKEEREIFAEVENLRLARLLSERSELCLNSVNKKKAEKGSVRDLATAAGIMLDKRKDLVGKGKNMVTHRLRVAWRGGEGAIEIEGGE